MAAVSPTFSGRAKSARPRAQIPHIRPARNSLAQGTIAGAYIVLSGRLRVYSIAPNGNQSTFYFVDPGETCVLAMNCLFNDLLYPAWVEAEWDTTLAIVPNATYRRLFERESAIQDLTVRALSTATFRLMETLEQIQGLNLEQRLASLILSHSSSDGRLRMTQQQMAQHLGTSREVIARFIAKFASRGWVRTQRGLLDIISANHLVYMISDVGR
jgi:CRP/FNR family transcriptional regulator